MAMSGWKRVESSRVPNNAIVADIRADVSCGDIYTEIYLSVYMRDVPFRARRMTNVQLRGVEFVKAIGYFRYLN